MAKAKRSDGGKTDTALVKPSDKNPNSLSVLGDPTKSRNVLMAETAASTVVRNAAVARPLADDVFGNMDETSVSDLDQCIKSLGEQCASARAGNLDQATDILVAQMATLATVFTDFLKRAASNMGQYPQAFERYMNFALKAQASCRNTAETLARIKRGGKQSMQITHVHTGGQAIVASSVETGGLRGGNVRTIEQSHEQAADAAFAALSGPDSARDTVLMPCPAGKDAMPIARGTCRSTGG